MSLFFNETNAETLNRLILAGTGINTSVLGNQLQINGNIGTVTSIALSLPNIFTVSGSPITSSGTLTGSFVTQSANTVFAGPTSGGATTPTFRSLVAADLPSLTGTYFAQNGNSFGALATLGTTDANDLRFIRNSTEIARINATGLGIGTTNPTAAFVINDNGTGQLTRMRLSTSGLSHNFTSIVPADVYAIHGWWNASLGGYFMGGLSKDGTNPAYVFVGYSGATGTVTAGCYEYRGAKRSGTTTTALTSSDVHSVYTNNGTIIATLMGTGSLNLGGTIQPTSTLFVNGSQGRALTTKTAAYTLTASDSYIVVTSGTHTQTLPTAVGIAGREYTIWNKGTGVVTVGTTSSQTIGNEPSGNPTTFVLKKSEWLTVISDGANWLIA